VTAADQHTLRICRSRAVERYGDGGAPVDHQRRAIRLPDVSAPDVDPVDLATGPGCPCRIVENRARFTVQPPEEQGDRRLVEQDLGAMLSRPLVELVVPVAVRLGIDDGWRLGLHDLLVHELQGGTGPFEVGPFGNELWIV